MTRVDSTLETTLLELYDAHAAGLLRYATACTHEPGAAEEAVQQVFLDLFSAWRRDEQVEDPREWLYRGIRQFFVRVEQRTDLRERTAEKMRREAEPVGTPDLDAPMRQREVRRRLARISSPREYEILQLRAEGFSYEEIAAFLEIHPGTVASTLSRALRKVRRAFNEDFG